MTFGPDGSLYVASYNNDQILRYDGSTGEVFVAAGSGGLVEPEYLTFTPAHQVRVILVRRGSALLHDTHLAC